MLSIKVFRTDVLQNLTSKSLENGNETDQDDYEGDTPGISSSVKIPLLLSLTVPSLLAYLFLIICTLTNKTFRSAPNNYAFLLLLFISFLSVSIDIPMITDRYRSSPTIRLTYALCLFWWFIDLFALCTSQFLMAWVSLERHLFIFHGQFLNRKWKNVCFHYLPPLVIIIYTFSFYGYVAFLYPCENTFYLEANSCGYYLCYGSNYSLAIFEVIFHGVVPSTCTLLFNCALLVRVSRSKARLRQSMNWRKYKSMIFQLMSIAFLYLSITFPYFFCTLLYSGGIPDGTAVVLARLSFFFYLIPLLLPLIFLITIPEMATKFRRILRLQANRQVGDVPMNSLTRNTRPIAAASRRQPF